MGVGAVLDITASALAAQRTALEVTGHNIANADTEGYSRQSLTLSTREPLPLGYVILGTGVRLVDVQRSYNRFANMNIDRQASTLGDMEARAEQLALLEASFNEVGGSGLGSHLSAFWAGWQDLANNPAGSAERNALLQNGEALASLLGSEGQTLESAATDLRQRIIQEVEGINSTLSQIADLNNEVLGTEVGGATANDLRDRRDQLLNSLSKAVGATYFEGPDGQVTVFIAGRLMVSGCNAYSLEAETSGDDVAIKWQGSQPSAEDISSQLEGGRLGGEITLLQETLPSYADKLDEFAAALIFEVNRLHSQGVGKQTLGSATATEAATDAAAAMSGAGSGLNFGSRIDDSGTASFRVHVYDSNGDPLLAGGTAITITAGMSLNGLATALDAVTGLDATVTGGKLTITAVSGEGAAGFAFSEDTSGVLAALGVNGFFSGHDAASIAVVATADTICAGRVQSDSSFGSGDGTNALAIADLEDSEVAIGSNTETFAASIASLVSSLGVEAGSVERDRQFREAMLNQLIARRDSQTGVSLDEEMSNMLKFQHAYTAAARLLQTADEMLKALVEMK